MLNILKQYYVPCICSKNSNVNCEQEREREKERERERERERGTHHVPFSRRREFYGTGCSLVTRWPPSDDFSETAFNVACSRNIKMWCAVTSCAVTLEIIYCTVACSRNINP